jgi:RimJ/RimL family protein N-acetyltransferase
VTTRLELDPLRLEHARQMAPLLADPALYTHIGGRPPSEAELAAQYARQVRGASADGRQGWLNWVMRLRPERLPVGLVQATLTGRRPRYAAELAWIVGSPYQGSGLATEGARAVMAWLGAAGCASFSAHIHPANTASAIVARRLGLVESALVEGGERRWVAPAPDSSAEVAPH